MRKTLLILSLGLFFLVQAGGICWSQTTERVSVSALGGDSNGASNLPSISSDGRYVAFQSGATDLVPVVTNGFIHIFVHDRQTGTTTQVSLHTNGTEADGPSSDPSISSNGRFVAFESEAGNLVAGDTAFPSGFPDIFVHDLQTGDTIWVSEDPLGGEGNGPSFNPSISADGRYVAFESEADLVVGDTSFFDIFVRDLLAGTTTLVSVNWNGDQADDNSYSPSISSDGRYVAFESFATDLMAVGTNGNGHIFVRDLLSGTTTMVSVDSSAIPIQGNGNSYSPAISSDGRYVAFESDSDNLVAGDTNGSTDIFVHDLQTGATTRISVDSSAIPIQGNSDSYSPAISFDGTSVAFVSDADNLVGGDDNGFPDIFLYEGDPLPPNTTQSEENNSSANISCFIATAASDWVNF